ncbi:unnamed protein product [Sympodiomycopsis kandeliae]
MRPPNMPTVVIEVPPTTATVTSTGTVGTTYTTGPPNMPTVVVEEPPNTATSTTDYSGTVTTSYTTGPPSMPTVVVEEPCKDPKGLSWAHYTSPYQKAEQPDYTYWKNKQPDDAGVTSNPGFQKDFAAGSDDMTTFYDSSKMVSKDYYSIDHRGFFRAPATGSYTFSAGKVDDFLDLWEGDNAISGWNNDNAAFEVTYSSGGEAESTTVNLQEGQYLPIRFFLVNTGGPNDNTGLGSGFNFTVTQDGNAIDASQDYVQYGCDGRTQKFPDFGSEN